MRGMQQQLGNLGLKINIHAFMTTGFRCGVNDTFRSSEMLFSVASQLPTFRDNLTVPKRRYITTNVRGVTTQKIEDLYFQASSTSTLSAEWSASRSDRFASCPLNRRLHGQKRWSGRSIQPVAQSLQFLSYPSPASLYIPDSKFKQQFYFVSHTTQLMQSQQFPAGAH